MIRMQKLNWKSQKESDTIIYIGLIFSILYAFLPVLKIVPNSIKIIIRTIPLFCCIFAAVKKKKMIYRLFVIILFGFFNAVIRLYSNANGVNAEIGFFMHIGIVLCYWITIFEGEYIVRYYDKEKAKKIVKLMLVLLSISSITTIIGNFIFPEITRASASSSEAINYWYNIGNYGFCYAAAFLIPSIVVLIKAKVIDKKCYLIVFLLYLVTLVCQLFTSIIIASIGLMMAMLEQKSHKRFLLIISIVFLLSFMFLFIFGGCFLQMVADVSSNFGVEILHERLDGLAKLLSRGKTYGDVHARIYLYRLSFNHFIKNPFCGLIGEKGFVRIHPVADDLILRGVGMDVSVGRHSDLIDLLGGGGLIGFIPLFYILNSYYDKCISFNNGSLMKNLFLILFLQYVIYGLADHAFSNYEVAFCVFVVPAFVELLINKFSLECGSK